MLAEPDTLVKNTSAGTSPGVYFREPAENQGDPEQVRLDYLVERICLPIRLNPEGVVVGVLEMRWLGSPKLHEDKPVPRHGPAELGFLAMRLATALKMNHLQKQNDKKALDHRSAIDGFSARLGRKGHLLRQCVNAISNAVDPFLLSSPSPDQQRILKTVSLNNNVLDKILKEAEMHKVEFLKRDRRPCDLRQLLSEVTGEANKEITKKELGIEVYNDKGNPVIVNINEELIHEAIGIIVENAIKAMPKVLKREKKLAIRLQVLSGNGLLIISDTGPGISEEDRKRINEREGFPLSRGGGVGLLIAWNNFEWHGWHMRHDPPVEGQTFGTVVTISFSL